MRGCLLEWLVRLSIFPKIVAIDSLNFVRGLSGDTHVVIDHVLSQCFAIYEDNLGVYGTNEVVSLFGETGGGDKDAFSSSLTLESPSKFLDFWSTDYAVPALCLDIDNI